MKREQMTDRLATSVYLSFLIGILCCWPTLCHAAEDPKPAAPTITFESQVLPILKARCVKCHAGAEPAQGLRLTTRREILRGGKSGPAMRISAAESRLDRTLQIRQLQTGLCYGALAMPTCRWTSVRYTAHSLTSLMATQLNSRLVIHRVTG